MLLILCDNTTERVALLGGQLCDNTPEKAALSCNMLWSQRPYEVVMSFTRSKPGFSVRKIGRISLQSHFLTDRDWLPVDLSGTTHPTTYLIGGRPTPTAARKGTAVILNRDPTAIKRIPIKIPLDRTSCSIDRTPVISYPVKILAN